MLPGFGRTGTPACPRVLWRYCTEQTRVSVLPGKLTHCTAAGCTDDVSRCHQLRVVGRGGSSTVAVMPEMILRPGLGTATLMAKVLMSCLVRLTSRCVAKSFSTPLKMTVPSRVFPEGS